MTTVRVQVTQEDIDNGEPGEPCMCPVALAVARALPHCGTPWIDAATVDFGEDESLLMTLPESAASFVRMFDESITRPYAPPFEFDLNVPDALLAGSVA